MPRLRVTPSLLRAALLLVPLVALLPLGRLAADWVEFERVVGIPLEPLPPRGFDWVRWQDRDGEIVAPSRRPASKAVPFG